MPATPYCAREDIDDVLSDEGVGYRATDEANQIEKSGLVTRTIRQASDRVNLYCGERYTAAELATSDYIISATAVIAAYMLSTRRGNPPPPSLEARYKEVFEELGKIQLGQADVPGIVTRGGSVPVLSNLRIDGRYRQSKVRVQPDISTGTPPQGGITQKMQTGLSGLDYEV